MDARVYRFDEVEIDTGQRVLRTAEGPLYLRARTFDLLIYLIENRQRIVPRLELRDALWSGVAVTENSVMQCVNEARKALGDDPREPRFIRTAMKAGYQFIADPELVEKAVVVPPPELPQPPSPREEPQLPIPRQETNSWTAKAAIFAACTVASVLIVGGIRNFDAGQPAEPPWWEAVWWKFDEGSGNRTSDQAGRLHGLLPEGVSWTPGISGSGLLFQRPEVVVQGSDSAGALPKGRAPRTLVAAVRVDGQPGGDTVALQIGYQNFDSGADHFYIGLHQTGVAVFGNHNVLIGRLPVTPGQWVHLAGVFEGGPEGLMRLYVNGQEDVAAKAEGGIAEQPTGPATAAEQPRWSIGRSLRAGTSFAGAIDDARIYARAIRPAEVRELHRCQMGFTDLRIGDRSYYFSPVFTNDIEFLPASPGESSTQMRNMGKDFSGAVFVDPKAGCGLSTIRAANLGQDLRIEAEYRFATAPVAGTGSGPITEAGPFFRSRPAAPSDGLIGGTSAGYWVQLLSTGQVRVLRLNPQATVAFTKAALVPKSWNPESWHKLVAEVRGDRLQVLLDGRAVAFDGVDGPGGVRLDAKWEATTPVGSNRGGTGIAFGASQHRGQAGGQQVRNIKVERLPAVSPGANGG